VLAVLVAVVVLGVIFAPWIVRLARSLAEERAERVHSQERAELAAHLHDSVLQTLALVQRRADRPRDVAALARRQERELRSWLSGGGERQAVERRLAAALEAAAEEVEAAQSVPVELVAVGDRALDAQGEALVAAAREAVLNASKFGGGAPVSVYLEASESGAHAFVRDRGPGFEPDRIPPDRRGVARVDRRPHGAPRRPRPNHERNRRGHRSRARARGRRAMTGPRVLLVDDHQLFRAGVRTELAPLVPVVGEASVAEAVRTIDALEPDVVLLDVHMPDGGGVAVIEQVAPRRPELRFLALSVSDAPEDVIAVIRAGARGYVTKTISGPELAAAVRRVRRRRRLLAAPGGLRARRLRRRRTGGGRGRTRRAHAARARGAPAHRPRLHVQGDRAPARDLRQDRRGARLLRAAQAAALEPVRAVALGGRVPAARPLSGTASGVAARRNAELARRACDHGRTMDERFCRVGELELRYETFGEPTDRRCCW
jgi:DNA-binding NarL/FixJ family response regulator